MTAPTSPPVLAAYAWPTNAHLMVDVARLGYIAHLTLDPTYGQGAWWKLHRPTRLVHHDLVPDGIDFRALPYGSGFFGTVAFDPPYVCTGGRETSTIPAFNSRYGLVHTPRTPAALQAMNDAGLAECARVVAPRGFILAKSADYVWSGKLVLGTHKTLSAGLALGLELVDRFEHVGRVRAQPKRTRKDGVPVRQHHARRNLSTLLVFRRSA